MLANNPDLQENKENMLDPFKTTMLLYIFPLLVSQKKCTLTVQSYPPANINVWSCTFHNYIPVLMLTTNTPGAALHASRRSLSIMLYLIYLHNIQMMVDIICQSYSL
jgi:hypothetical protein